MATQLLNADADLSTIQDLLGHTHITATQRYCRVSNLKVQRDYYNAIELVMQRSHAGSGSGQLLSKKLNVADNHMLYIQREGLVSDTKNESEENWM